MEHISFADIPAEYTDPHNRFEVKNDGTTIWINGRTGLIGRYNKRRMDVHDRHSKCLDCSDKGLAAFVESMRQYHQIDLLNLSEDRQSSP
ncbi:MAG: hypothetical protein HC778_00070 [Chamaesiphon sp. CSU_1_12]|nr:hypothetical protein [Chamaesiphon sp. CSU_1_12]